MRKIILFFCMMCFFQSDFSYKTSEFLALRLDFLQEKKDKIKKKYDTRIYEDISSSCCSEYIADRIDKSWKKSKKEETSSYSKKNEKV